MPQVLLVEAEGVLQVLLVETVEVPQVLLVEAEEDVKEVDEVEEAELLLVVESAMIDGKRVSSNYKHLASSGTLLFYSIGLTACSCQGATPTLSRGRPSSGCCT